jgi:hypothetical protein
MPEMVDNPSVKADYCLSLKATHLIKRKIRSPSMAIQTARVIDLDEYRARRESQDRKPQSTSVLQPLWWYPVLMWLPMPATALYWHSALME